MVEVTLPNTEMGLMGYSPLKAKALRHERAYAYALPILQILDPST
ncbi:hypothetical protein [Coleofasciculus sp. H7-2]